MNPDRRVIRRIALTADRVGLALGGDFRQHWRRRDGLGLPRQFSLIEVAGVVVAQQQLPAFDCQVFRLRHTRQAQARLCDPAFALLLEQLQLRSLWIKRDHTTRHQRHGTGCALGIVEQRHRDAFHLGFRVRRVGPPADVLLIDQQLIGGVVHLAELRRRRQRQAAYTLGLCQQRRTIAHQPLLALALFAHQENKQVGRRVAIQAQAVDRIVAGRQVQRRAPAFAGAIQADQHGLLALVIQGGHQHLGPGGAGVEAAEVTLETRQFGAFVIEQQQAVAGAGGQAFGAVGQEGQRLGVQARCPTSQGQVGGQRMAAGGQGHQQVQLGKSHEQANPSKTMKNPCGRGLAPDGSGSANKSGD